VCSFWIDDIEMREHNLDRSVEAVEIEPIKSGVWCVCAKPHEEVAHNRVAPHPLWKTKKAPKRVLGSTIGSGSSVTTNPTMNAMCVGPIGFDGNRIEALLDDELPRDSCALTIELVGSVRRHTKQNEA